ncbi:hypothetical protein FB451DRAFT_747459 [Mycena latifolia]|nr:hypothetical protein FB451DRAFT_747459 [Mycena latifolia]
MLSSAAAPGINMAPYEFKKMKRTGTARRIQIEESKIIPIGSRSHASSSYSGHTPQDNTDDSFNKLYFTSSAAKYDALIKRFMVGAPEGGDYHSVYRGTQPYEEAHALFAAISCIWSDRWYDAFRKATDHIDLQSLWLHDLVFLQKQADPRLSWDNTQLVYTRGAAVPASGFLALLDYVSTCMQQSGPNASLKLDQLRASFPHQFAPARHIPGLPRIAGGYVVIAYWGEVGSATFRARYEQGLLRRTEFSSIVIHCATLLFGEHVRPIGIPFLNCQGLPDGQRHFYETLLIHYARPYQTLNIKLGVRSVRDGSAISYSLDNRLNVRFYPINPHSQRNSGVMTVKVGVERGVLIWVKPMQGKGRVFVLGPKLYVVDDEHGVIFSSLLADLGWNTTRIHTKTHTLQTTITQCALQEGLISFDYYKSIMGPPQSLKWTGRIATLFQMALEAIPRPAELGL